MLVLLVVIQHPTSILSSLMPLSDKNRPAFYNAFYRRTTLFLLTISSVPPPEETSKRKESFASTENLIKGWKGNPQNSQHKKDSPITNNQSILNSMNYYQPLMNFALMIWFKKCHLFLVWFFLQDIFSIFCGTSL